VAAGLKIPPGPIALQQRPRLRPIITSSPIAMTMALDIGDERPRLRRSREFETRASGT
jgi:hypothetical protein